jgi:hypothetical protein
VEKTAFSRKKTVFASKWNKNLRKKLVKCYTGNIAFYGAEIWTLRKVDQKYLGSFEMWCWRRTENISWTDRVRKEEVLLRVKEERNILRTIKRRKANWIGHIWRRNCLLKHVTEGKIGRRVEVTGRRGKRRKQLLDDREEKRGYCKLKEEALDRTVWRTGFGNGPVVRQTVMMMMMMMMSKDGVSSSDCIAFNCRMIGK